jgi:hypothetical protein
MFSPLTADTTAISARPTTSRTSVVLVWRLLAIGGPPDSYFSTRGI